MSDKTAKKQNKKRGRMPSWVMPLIKTGILAVDIILAISSFCLAFVWYEKAAVLAENVSLNSFWSEKFEPYGILLWLIIPIRVLTIKAQNLYRLRGEFSFFDDNLKLLKAVSIGSLLIVAGAFLYRGGFEFRAFSYSRAVFLYDFLFFVLFIMLWRLIVRSVQILARNRGINLIPTLIVGNGREAELCIEEIQTNKSLGYQIVGVISVEQKENLKEFCGIEVLGTIKDLSELVPQTAANEVIITENNISGEVLFEVMMRCGRRKGVEFKIIPNLFNSLPRKTEAEQLGSLPMIQLFRQPLSSFSRIVKRIEDILISATALTVLLPLLLVIVGLIKLDSKGKIFYKQKRVGMDGRQFSFYKFRTMVEGNDDSRHREFLKDYIAGKAESQSEDEAVFKLQDDARVTRIGKILRRYSLDELPQIFNVLRGEMSVVGPRPPIPYEVEEYNFSQRRRLEIKPGITGLWQVSGRNRLTFEEMLRLDIFYIENWSLWLDLKIIFLTPIAMFRGDGAK